MFNHKHYVPVLKGKPAEFQAVTQLKTVASITPLFEAIPSKPANLIPAQLDKHKWPKIAPYFLDLLFYKASGAAAVATAMSTAISLHQTAIPVTGTGRSPAYQQAVEKYTDSKRGVAVRLIPDDFEDQAELSKALTALGSLLKIDASSTDLLIDLGSVAGQQPSIIAQIIRAHLGMLPSSASWRTITVISGAFPLGMDSTLTRSAWDLRPRIDWTAWLAVINGSNKPNRMPAYGDYSVSHPGLPPEGQATILAQLRYSTAPNFMIWKGHNVRKHQSGYTQFNAICKDLIQKPEYRGPSFSAGDLEIKAKATNAGSPGNPQIWRKIGTNHHFETVLDQIANLP
jgi:hypothetical protein